MQVARSSMSDDEEEAPAELRISLDEPSFDFRGGHSPSMLRRRLIWLAAGILALVFLYCAVTPWTRAPRAVYGAAKPSTFDYAPYVNPFIGSEGAKPGLAFGGGQIFVGASVPFGVAKVGIDTSEGSNRFATINGGYTPKGLVTAVSMMHESGTGGPPKYGIISQMPLASLEGVNLLDNRTYWQQRVGQDTASVGYFSTKLKNGVGIELSGGRHSGIFQYDFPSSERHVLVDVSHLLPQPGAGTQRGQWWDGGEIHLQSRGSVYTGWGSYGGGFSNSAPMTTYFCGEFQDVPDEARTFRGRNTHPGVAQHGWANGIDPEPTFGTDSQVSGPMNDRIGAIFSWTKSSKTSIRSRLGISMISVEKACAFKDSELPSWNVQDAVTASVQEWNADVFSKFHVSKQDGLNRTNLVLLYSSLYFMHLMPSDRSGENPLWEGSDSWDDFYALWDIFRCTVSLYHLIQPTYYASMIRSLIEIWKWDGFMPDGRSGNYNGMVQGGSNADNVLADAFIKDLPGVNWTEAYAAMVKDATVSPYNQNNVLDPTGDIQQGRGALQDWLKLGYISNDHYTRSISRTVEYASNDYSLAVVAKGLGLPDSEYKKWIQRAAQWQNLWKDDLESQGFKGFLTPRHSDGWWENEDYNPAKCKGGCGWSGLTYEGTPFEYSFTVPHDMETLVQKMGGEKEFERRLDYIFSPNSSEASQGPNGLGIDTIMNIGNEPDFSTPYEYNYINKQHKTVEKVRELSNRYFHDSNYGVPGNSDAGALNSWLIWAMLGIYPVVTQTVYLIGSPWFAEVNVTINDHQTLTIRANNLDNNNSFYVQSVKINGEAWERNWFDHADVMVDGGTIEFDMGSEPVVWEKGDVPPSPGHWVLDPIR